MNNVYEEPTMEIIKLENEDVITDSFGDGGVEDDW